jgi:hypothetical protein
MHLMLGECHENSTAASRQYAEKYPDRVHPGRKFFEAIHRNLCDNGYIASRKEGGGRKV